MHNFKNIYINNWFSVVGPLEKNSNLKNFEEIDTPHLLNSVIYQNYDALVDYSKQEIASCRQDLDQIYIRANDEDSWTALDVYTYQKQYQIASTVLYDILQEKKLERQKSGTQQQKRKKR